MGQDTHDRPDGSKVVYEHLESHVRGQIQNWIQETFCVIRLRNAEDPCHHCICGLFLHERP